MSHADIEPPGWPLWALCVIRMMCLRRVTAFFLRARMSSSETSTTARPPPAPTERWRAINKGFVASHPGLRVGRIHARTPAATAQRQTTATTANTPLIPAAANAKAKRPEAKVKIQKTSRRSGSKVQRFVHRDGRNFGGAPGAIRARELGRADEGLRTAGGKIN